MTTWVFMWWCSECITHSSGSALCGFRVPLQRSLELRGGRRMLTVSWNKKSLQRGSVVAVGLFSMHFPFSFNSEVIGLTG